MVIIPETWGPVSSHKKIQAPKPYTAIKANRSWGAHHFWREMLSETTEQVYEANLGPRSGDCNWYTQSLNRQIWVKTWLHSIVQSNLVFFFPHTKHLPHPDMALWGQQQQYRLCTWIPIAVSFVSCLLPSSVLLPSDSFRSAEFLLKLKYLWTRVSFSVNPETSDLFGSKEVDTAVPTKCHQLLALVIWSDHPVS